MIFFLPKNFTKTLRVSNWKESVTLKQIPPFSQILQAAQSFLPSDSSSPLLLTLSRCKMNPMLSLPGMKTSISLSISPQNKRVPGPAFLPVCSVTSGPFSSQYSGSCTAAPGPSNLLTVRISNPLCLDYLLLPAAQETPTHPSRAKSTPPASSGG